MDLATSIVAMTKAATLQTAQYKVIAKQHDMQMELVNMLDRHAQAAPPPGQGTQVDKTA